jgi:23S rRNA (adenine1618-N6)-methyltransferase
LHTNNRHKQGYNFSKLIKVLPSLKTHVIKNKFTQQATINFADPVAVKLLNLALLKCDYKIIEWDIPTGYLCPAIPGRVDYIHHLKELIDLNPLGVVVPATKTSVLDIGTGASCIYPILGQKEYDWQFVASDIDPLSIKSANQIIAADCNLKNNINCRLQQNSQAIFEGIIRDNEFYHLTMCNPPFHKSLLHAKQGSEKKWKNLNSDQFKQTKKVNLNFGGQKAELFCPGGELKFIQSMIKESKGYKQQVLWFTCLVSKGEHLKKLKFNLTKSGATHIKVVKMSQGQKISRFIAWSFHNPQ